MFHDFNEGTKELKKKIVPTRSKSDNESFVLLCVKTIKTKPSQENLYIATCKVIEVLTLVDLTALFKCVYKDSKKTWPGLNTGKMVPAMPITYAGKVPMDGL